MISTRDMKERAEQRRWFQCPTWTYARSGGDFNAWYERTRGATVISTADAKCHLDAHTVPLTHMMSLPRVSSFSNKKGTDNSRRQPLCSTNSNSVYATVEYEKRFIISRCRSSVFSLNRLSPLKQSLLVWPSNICNLASNVDNKKETKSNAH